MAGRLRAAALVATALAAPVLLAPLNRGWRWLGLALRLVVSNLVLTVLFFAVVTPMAAIMRLLGRRPLALERDRAAASYWFPRDPPGPSRRQPAQDPFYGAGYRRLADVRGLRHAEPGHDVHRGAGQRDDVAVAIALRALAVAVPARCRGPAPQMCVRLSFEEVADEVVGREADRLGMVRLLVAPDLDMPDPPRNEVGRPAIEHEVAIVAGEHDARRIRAQVADLPQDRREQRGRLVRDEDRAAARAAGSPSRRKP